MDTDPLATLDPSDLSGEPDIELRGNVDPKALKSRDKPLWPSRRQA
jgi:hypothetical protein